MADNRNADGTGTSITPAKSHSWSQLPGESAEAYAGFKAYAALPAGERTIAAAYRKLKGVGPDAKVPGYFGKWSSQWNWRQRAADWDNHIQSLGEVADVAQLQAARRQTVEQEPPYVTTRTERSGLRTLRRRWKARSEPGLWHWAGQKRSD